MDEHRRAPGGSWYADGSPDEGRGWAPDDRCDAAAAAGETCAGGGAPPGDEACAGGGAPPGDEASGDWADPARGAGTPPLCSPTGVEHFSDALPPPYDALSPKSRAANPRPRTVSYGQEEGFMAQWALDFDAAYAASGVPNLVLFEPVQHFLMDLVPTLVPVLATTCKSSREFYAARVAEGRAFDGYDDARYAAWAPLARYAGSAHRAALQRLLPREFHAALTVTLADGVTDAALDCFGSYVSAGGAATIAGALLDGADISTINLRGNGLGDDGATLMAVALELKESPLRVLSLWSNDISDAGAIKLADALAVNTSLTTLDLAGNSIGEAGADRLTAAVARNRRLASLDLRNNDVDARDPKAAQERRRRARKARRESMEHAAALAAEDPGGP